MLASQGIRQQTGDGWGLGKALWVSEMVSFQESTHPLEQAGVTHMMKMAFEKECEKWCKEVGGLCLCSMCHPMQVLQRHLFLASSAAFRIDMDWNSLLRLHLSSFICIASCSRPPFTPATAPAVSFMLAKFDSASRQPHHRHRG